MEHLRQKSAQKINLNRILAEENTLLDFEKRKELEKDKKKRRKNY